MNLKKFGAAICVILFVVVAAPRSASAATITLSAVNGNLYQQGVQNPCIFANNSCQQPAGFPATDVPTQGSPNSYDLVSNYTVSQLLPYLNNGSLQIGVDINQASGQPAQTLSSFTMSINNVLTDTFTGSTGNVPATNNGNGYADYLLSNFTSIANLPGNTLISFHFQFTGANDGAENLFLVAGPGNTPVPEPASMLLVGSGLLLAARARRRKTN